MRCYECRYLDRSKVLTCYPPNYYCTYDKTTHFADDECKYEHYPIVRCKDCRYFKKIAERSDSGLCNKDIVASAWKENGYCSRGERKGGEDK